MDNEKVWQVALTEHAPVGELKCLLATEMTRSEARIAEGCATAAVALALGFEAIRMDVKPAQAQRLGGEGGSMCIIRPDRNLLTVDVERMSDEA